MPVAVVGEEATSTTAVKAAITSISPPSKSTAPSTRPHDPPQAASIPHSSPSTKIKASVGHVPCMRRWGRWEAGLACSLLEGKYGPGSVAKPPPPAPPPAAPAPPKSPAPLPPVPKPPTPKQPTQAPTPKKSDGGGGWRGVGPVRAVPRGIFSLWEPRNV